MPTLAGLCDADLPQRKIDGHDIYPLLRGQADARSPHEAYVLLHGPGTVRAGKWKFYPWPEGQERRPAGKRKRDGLAVQLYDTVADIGEKTNLAADHPDVVQRLQAAYDAHQAEVDANQRPTAPLKRDPAAASAARP